MNNEIERIKAYIERRRKARGLEFNGIHGFDVSPSGGFELTVSDIEALIAKVESLTRENLELTRRYEEQKLQDKRLDVALQRACAKEGA